MRELTVAEISSVAGGIVVPNVNQRLNPDYSGFSGGGGSITCDDLIFGAGMAAGFAGTFGGIGRVFSGGFTMAAAGLAYFCDTRAGS